MNFIKKCIYWGLIAYSSSGHLFCKTAPQMKTAQLILESISITVSPLLRSQSKVNVGLCTIGVIAILYYSSRSWFGLLFITMPLIVLGASGWCMNYYKLDRKNFKIFINSKIKIHFRELNESEKAIFDTGFDKAEQILECYATGITVCAALFYCLYDEGEKIVTPLAHKIRDFFKED